MRSYPHLKPEHHDLLQDASRALLGAVGPRPWAEGFYLAGSAALTLYLGHRRVRDLDLMSPRNPLRSPQRRTLLEAMVMLDEEVEVETARDGFLYLRCRGDVGLRWYYYPYPQVEPLGTAGGMAVSSALDLGLMKLGAVISRGSRRDFVDLYLLCRHIPLAELLAHAETKFPRVRDFPLQALKGLADRQQAQAEPMPHLALELSWQEVEHWLRDDVRDLARRSIGWTALTLEASQSTAEPPPEHDEHPR